MVFTMITLLSFMLLDNKIVVHTKDRIDNALTVSAFSGSLCDYEKMVDSMTIAKDKTESVITYNFDQIYAHADIYIDYESACENIKSIFEENVLLQEIKNQTAGEFQIVSVIIYNVGEELEIYKFENSKETYDRIDNYGNDKYISSPNGVCIDCTSVYIKAEFTFEGIFHHSRQVSLEKCIALKFAKE